MTDCLDPSWVPQRRRCAGSTLWTKVLQNVSGPAGMAVIVIGCQRTLKVSRAALNYAES